MTARHRRTKPWTGPSAPSWADPVPRPNAEVPSGIRTTDGFRTVDRRTPRSSAASGACTTDGFRTVDRRTPRSAASGACTTDDFRTVDRRTPRSSRGEGARRLRTPVRAELPPQLVDFNAGAASALFQGMVRIRSVSATESGQVNVWAKPAEARGYDPRLMDAVAILAFHYLSCGAPRVARVLFEGLCAVRSEWSYAFLGLGVCRMMENALEPAQAALEQAARLDRQDPQARLNLAEIAVRHGERRRARQLLKDLMALPGTTERQRRRARGLAVLIEGA